MKRKSENFQLEPQTKRKACDFKDNADTFECKNERNHAKEEFYLSQDLADIHFVFESADGKSELIPAHRLQLCSSDIFKKLFSNQWKEIDEVRIYDASAAEFKEFLQFFYLSRINLTTENFEGVLYLGDKYRIGECVTACENLMIKKLTNGQFLAENICLAYAYAIHFKLKRFKEYCEMVISLKTEEVLISRSFLQSDRQTLGHILRIESLQCSEFNLFLACLEWVKVNSKRLSSPIDDLSLGEIFRDIRFKLLSYSEILYVNRNLHDGFTPQQYGEIVKMIASEDKQNVHNNHERRFNKLVEVEFFKRKLMGSVICHINEVEKIYFSTNRPFLLRKLRSCLDPRYSFSTRITIIERSSIEHSDKGEILYCGEVNDFNTVDLCFDDLILIRPGFIYAVQMEQTPVGFPCLFDRMKSEIEIESGITIRFHEYSKKFISRPFSILENCDSMISGMSICPI